MAMLFWKIATITIDAFWEGHPLAAMVFQTSNYWFNDAMVALHRSSLTQSPTNTYVLSQKFASLHSLKVLRDYFALHKGPFTPVILLWTHTTWTPWRSCGRSLRGWKPSSWSWLDGVGMICRGGGPTTWTWRQSGSGFWRLSSRQLQGKKGLLDSNPIFFPKDIQRRICLLVQ